MEPQVDLGNVIARLGTKIGELETRNALLTTQVEAYQAQETTTESIDKKEE